MTAKNAGWAWDWGGADLPVGYILIRPASPRLVADWSDRAGGWGGCVMRKVQRLDVAAVAIGLGGAIVLAIVALVG